MVYRPKHPLTYRTIEPRYEGVPYGNGKLKDGYSIAVDGEIWPGMVMAEEGALRFVLSDGDDFGDGGNGGEFFGLSHHWFAAEVDDTNAGLNPIAIWKGGGTYFVFNPALDPEADYSVPSSGVKELVAGATSSGNKGMLIPRPDANVQPTVAILLNEIANGIELELLPPSHTY